MRLPASAAAGKIATSDASGNISWSANPTPAQDLLWAVTPNCIAVPFSRASPVPWVTTAAVASGTLRLIGGFVLPAGVAISHVKMFIGSTGASTPTHHWVALLDTAGNVLATGTDALTTAITTTSFPVYNISYTSPSTVAAYVGYLVAGGTPTLLAISGIATTTPGSPSLSLSGSAGLTTPGSLGGSSSLGSTLGPWPYCEVY